MRGADGWRSRAPWRSNGATLNGFVGGGRSSRRLPSRLSVAVVSIDTTNTVDTGKAVTTSQVRVADTENKLAGAGVVSVVPLHAWSASVAQTQMVPA